MCAGVKQVLFEDTQRAVTGRETIQFGVKYLDEFYKPNKTTVVLRCDYRGFSIMINRIRANYFNLGESLARKGYVATLRCLCGAESKT